MTEPSPSVRERLAPEVVAALLSAVLIAGLAAVAVLGGASLETAPGSNPAPSGAASRPPVPEHAATARLLSILNRRLLAHRAALAEELASPPIETEPLVATIRQVNSAAVLGADAAALLRRTPSARTIGTDLEAYYREVIAIGEETLGISLQQGDQYAKAAQRLIDTLGDLPAFEERLVALLLVADASPGPSAPPSLAAASPSLAPASPPPASPTAPPSSPSPPPSTGPSPSPNPPTEAGLLANGSFEDPSLTPWQLQLSDGSVATVTSDQSGPFDGARAARIDIAAAAAARTSIAFRQGGLAVEAGRRYVVSAAIRAATQREVRIRLVGAGGDTYGTRLYVAGPTWQSVQFELSVFVSDANAALEVDLGRDAATTWLDATGLEAAPP